MRPPRYRNQHQQMTNNNSNNSPSHNNTEQQDQKLRDAKEIADDTLILKRFKVVQLIGTGNYAKVYKALSQSGREVAIKLINLSNTSDHYKHKFLPRELTILKKISHPNLCKVHEIMQVSDRVCIVMQYCSRGTIADLLHRLGPFSEPVARYLFVPTADAVNYLHSIDIAHRDLKIENILLDNDFNPKLTDFSYSVFTSSVSPTGHGRGHTSVAPAAATKAAAHGSNSANAATNYHHQQQPQPQQQQQTINLRRDQCGAGVRSPREPLVQPVKLNETFCGTLPYLSPEMVRQHPYDSKKTDTWSLGVCLFIMLNDKAPFSFDDIKSMVKRQLARDYKFRANAEFSSELKELIWSMLEPDYSKRITAGEIISHSWSLGQREKPSAHAILAHENSLI